MGSRSARSRSSRKKATSTRRFTPGRSLAARGELLDAQPDVTIPAGVGLEIDEMASAGRLAESFERIGQLVEHRESLLLGGRRAVEPRCSSHSTGSFQLAATDMPVCPVQPRPWSRVGRTIASRRSTMASSVRPSARYSSAHCKDRSRALPVRRRSASTSLESIPCHRTQAPVQWIIRSCSRRWTSVVLARQPPSVPRSGAPSSSMARRTRCACARSPDRARADPSAMTRASAPCPGPGTRRRAVSGPSGAARRDRVHAELNQLDQSAGMWGAARTKVCNVSIACFQLPASSAARRPRQCSHRPTRCVLQLSRSSAISIDVRMPCRVERQRTHERRAALELVSSRQLPGRSSDDPPRVFRDIVRLRLSLRRGGSRPAGAPPRAAHAHQTVRHASFVATIRRRSAS